MPYTHHDLQKDSVTSSFPNRAFPFPRISHRRKPYRDIRQPWHTKGSDSDSDGDTYEATTSSTSIRLCDPVAFFPPELALMCLWQVLPLRNDCNYPAALIELTSVSSSWQELLLSASYLWATIHIRYSAYDLMAIIGLSLHLSAEAPLNLVVWNTLGPEWEDIRSLLLPHTLRIHSLALGYDPPIYHDSPYVGAAYISLASDIFNSLHPLPRLVDLDFGRALHIDPSQLKTLELPSGIRISNKIHVSLQNFKGLDRSLPIFFGRDPPRSDRLGPGMVIFMSDHLSSHQVMYSKLLPIGLHDYSTNSINSTIFSLNSSISFLADILSFLEGTERSTHVSASSSHMTFVNSSLNTCQLCNKKTGSLSRALGCVRSHFRLRPFRCPGCSTCNAKNGFASFCTYNLLLNHIGPTTCAVCGTQQTKYWGQDKGGDPLCSGCEPLLTNVKAVHFGTQLEQVRLFRKEQKPAVLAGDYQSENEISDDDTLSHSDYLPKEQPSLALVPVNLPLYNAMASAQERLGDLYIKLEKIVLSKDGSAVEGTVLVRNIAFEKWVVVRFTFDWWTTTSEVTARYSGSIPRENADLFSFVIQLPEFTRRIEDKRLFFALRYSTKGREAWDNNRGDNYQLRFRTEKKAQVQRTSPFVSQHPPSWPVKSANVDQMADLRKKLETVVREDEESSGLQSWDVLTAKLRAKNMHIEEDREAKKEVSLRSRYDFDASSKFKWEPPKELPKYRGSPPETQAAPFPSLRPAHRGSYSTSGASVDVTRPRHRQRKGYFDSYIDSTSSAAARERRMETADATPSTNTEVVTPSVLVAEDDTETPSSETEEISSSTSSSCTNDTPAIV